MQQALQSSNAVYALSMPHVGFKGVLPASSARRCLSISLRISVNVSGMARFANCSFAAAFVSLAGMQAARSTAT